MACLERTLSGELEAPLCVVKRTEGMNNIEQRLRFTMVAYIGGSRPAVSCAQVVEALGAIGVPAGEVSVHEFAPEDFLVVFAMAAHKSRVAARTSVEHAGFSLFFRSWNHQAHATHVSLDSRVELLIEGVPPHAWDTAVVEDLLGRSCAVEEVAEETASRRDLSSFKLRAWTSDLDSIPVARTLVVPEPPANTVVSGSTSARKEPELPALKYKILVHVTKVEQLVCDAVVQRDVVVPGDGRGGGGGGGRRRWVSRTQPWQKGAPDRHGANASGVHSGSGQRHVSGPATVWQLPRLPRPGPIAVQMENECLESDLHFAAAEIESADKAGEMVETGLDLSTSGSDVNGVLAPQKEMEGRQEDLGVVDPEGVQSLTANQDRDSDRAVALPDSVADPEVRGDSDCGQEGGDPILDKSVECQGTQDGHESNKELQLLGEESGQEIEGEKDTYALGSALESDRVQMSQGEECQASLSETRRELSMVVASQPVESHVNSQVEDLAALNRIKLFCAKFLKTLAPPLLKEIDVARKLAESEPCTPRRITRSSGANSAMSCDKPLKKASAAEMVLLKALGITPTDLAVNDEDLRMFKEMFDSPLREAQLRVVAAIFGKIMPSSFEHSEVGRLDMTAH
jgi:hypothetical protein